MASNVRKIRKPLIGFVVSASIFILLLVCVVSQHKNAPVNKAQIEISNITQNNGSVRIDWECDNVGVTSYQIFRKDDDKSNFKFLDSVENHKKYYIDKQVKSGNTYGYYIRAFDSRKQTDNYSKSPYIYIYIY